MVKPKGREAFASAYTPAATRHYEDALRAAAIDAMAGRPPFDGPLEVLVLAYMPIPASWSAKKAAAAAAGDLRPTGRPDVDNLGKNVDAFNPYRDPKTGIRIPIVWTDDAVVVDIRVVKIYAQRQPGIIVEVRRAGPPPTPWAGPIRAT